MKKFPTFWERVLSAVLMGLCVLGIVVSFTGAMVLNIAITDGITSYFKWDSEIGFGVLVGLMVIEVFTVVGFFDPVNLRKKEPKVLKKSLKKSKK